MVVCNIAIDCLIYLYTAQLILDCATCANRQSALQ